MLFAMFCVVPYLEFKVKLYGLLGTQFVMLCYVGLVRPFQSRKYQQITVINESLVILAILMGFNVQRYTGTVTDAFNRIILGIFAIMVILNVLFIGWYIYKFLYPVGGAGKGRGGTSRVSQIHGSPGSNSGKFGQSPPVRNTNGAHNKPDRSYNNYES